MLKLDASLTLLLSTYLCGHKEALWTSSKARFDLGEGP